MVRKAARAVCGVCGVALVLAATASTAHACRGCSPVPEIDPQSAAGALAMLTGGVLLMTDRFRRK
jgi:hypothetical protein